MEESWKRADGVLDNRVAVRDVREAFAGKGRYVGGQCARQQGRRDSPWPSAIVVIEVYMNRAASIHEPLFH